MKIAIVGYGKMGRLIAEIALTRHHEVVIVDPFSTAAHHKNLDELVEQQIDCAIEFTTPEQVVKNITKLTDLKINQVVGTTGWYNEIPQIKNLIAKSSIGFLYAANFSLGVNLFMQLTKVAAQIVNNFPEYDISALEFHHNKKSDSPSGTALKLADILLENIERKTTLLTNTCDRQIEPHELHFPSLRCGSFPGTHEIIFDSDADTISLKHTARSRSGFALGAVIAAEWLNQRQGFFEIDQLIADLIGSKK
jgi:4-hydroxy-tetrahydrodipicolinate reductase